MKLVTLALLLFVVTLTTLAQQPQCRGKRYDKKTGDSVQCHSPFVMKSGYCPAHDPNTPRCGQPTTTTGLPCRKRVDKPGDRCQCHPKKEA